jgi:hypothetical protein
VSLVARGLGRGAAAILVTAGLGLALQVTPPEPPQAGGGGVAVRQEARTEARPVARPVQPQVREPSKEPALETALQAALRKALAGPSGAALDALAKANAPEPTPAAILAQAEPFGAAATLAALRLANPQEAPDATLAQADATLAQAEEPSAQEEEDPKQALAADNRRRIAMLLAIIAAT